MDFCRHLLPHIPVMPRLIGHPRDVRLGLGEAADEPVLVGVLVQPVVDLVPGGVDSVGVDVHRQPQLVLAVDIVDVNYQLLDTNQENTAVQKWLLENSWRYGFILRYPTDQTDVTGIVYEPWHYRYVGKEYAQDIYKKGLCLEQYLEQWGK